MKEDDPYRTTTWSCFVMRCGRIPEVQYYNDDVEFVDLYSDDLLHVGADPPDTVDVDWGLFSSTAVRR